MQRHFRQFLLHNLFLLSVLFLFNLQAETNPSIEAHSRLVTDRLVAPCCWRENLTTHQSPEAEKIRAEIHALIAAGNDPEDIVDTYVQRFGERILREPGGFAFAWLVSIPLLVLIAGITLVITYLRKLSTKHPEAGLRTLPQLPDDADQGAYL